MGKKRTVDDLAQKIGTVDLKMSGSMLVKVLNKKLGGKENGSLFTYTDIQQYYLRGRLPSQYLGLKLKLEESAIGKFLRVYKKIEDESKEDRR